MKTGGKLLGKGSYGCVFKPKLTCIGDNIGDNIEGNDTVSKIYFRKTGFDEASNEYNINSQIKAIKNYDKWAYIYTNKCYPGSYNDMLKEDPEVGKCERLYNTSEIIMLQGKYGGVDLGSYIVDNLTRNYHKSNFVDMYHDYLCMFKNILKGLVDMNAHNMCHFDIKYDNLVIQKRVIKLIDFGLTNNSLTNIKEINKRAYSELYHINRFYIPYPPEYIYTTNYSDYTSYLQKEHEMLNNGIYRRGHTFLRSIHEKLIHDVDDFDKYISDLIIQNLENPLTSIQIKNLYDKIDIYSIGMVFIYFIRDLKEVSDFVDNSTLKLFNNPKIRPFINLAKKMLILNYNDRISAEDAYNEYCNILSKFKSKNTYPKKSKRKRTRKLKINRKRKVSRKRR